MEILHFDMIKTILISSVLTTGFFARFEKPWYHLSPTLLWIDSTKKKNYQNRILF